MPHLIQRSWKSARRILIAILAAGAMAGFGGIAVARASPSDADPTTPAQASHPPIRSLTADDARADIAILRRALETIHPGLYRRASQRDMDRAFADLGQELDPSITDAELYRRISALLAMIRCTHTKADQTGAVEAWREDHPGHLPFRFRLFGRRMLVVSSDPAQPLLPRGTEILAINGRAVPDLVRTLGRYVPIDGFTEPSRAAFLADDGDLMGADFDHFYPYVFGFPDKWVLALRERDRAPVREVTLAPISFRAWVNLPNEGRPFRQNFSDAVTWRMLKGDVGYLRVDSFVNYRTPVDAAALYAQAMADLRKSGARKLIVDLRHNGGGSNDAALALIDALATMPYVYQHAIRYRAVRYDDLPRYISSWGDRDSLFNPPLDRFVNTADGWYDLRPALAPDVLQERRPAPDAFTGPVSVLTGPANASGATMVIARLRDMGRVRLVGERSGGSADGPTAGMIFNVRLPHSDISVRVPLVFNQMNVARFDRRGGIAPDLRVRLTAEDFRSGRDRTLERAVAELVKTPVLPSAR